MNTTFTNKDTYMGFRKITLNFSENLAWGAVEYTVYRNMRAWLDNNKVQHKFYWENTGAYLPDILYIEDNDAATMFVLKFNAYP